MNDILTVAEVAAILGKSTRAVYRLMDRTLDPMPYKDVGGRVVVTDVFWAWMRNERDPKVTPKSGKDRQSSVRRVAKCTR